MSKISLNALVNGMSGKLGNAVLRRRGSRTVMASMPKERTSEFSIKEKAQQARFKRGAAYAKEAMKNPAIRAEYQQSAKKRESNAFAIALGDFLKPPSIDQIKTDGYTGKVNDIIAIQASDDFKVAAVKVAIRLPNDVLHESGVATFDGQALDWKYSITVANASVTGTKIQVIAMDYPGNEASSEHVM
ncbi:MAG TPA: hypothetical protein PLJ60_19770 [Chryseolinea sp.]|nr:hypothetical protein [Chryseolinea sp.]HPH46195.1 hypothetical protein [Chryseolinea sp.]HPM32582.1 hypothetical protein [Chryseolinea sp.]